jgi:hypothetical protein
MSKVANILPHFATYTQPFSMICKEVALGSHIKDILTFSEEFASHDI